MTDYMTVEEFAEEAQIHLMTAYRLIKAGKVPAQKIEGGWRVSKEWFELMLRGE